MTFDQTAKYAREGNKAILGWALSIIASVLGILQFIFQYHHANDSIPLNSFTEANKITTHTRESTITKTTVVLTVVRRSGVKEKFIVSETTTVVEHPRADLSAEWYYNKPLEIDLSKSMPKPRPESRQKSWERATEEKATPADSLEQDDSSRDIEPDPPVRVFEPNPETTFNVQPKPKHQSPPNLPAHNAGKLLSQMQNTGYLFYQKANQHSLGKISHREWLTFLKATSKKLDKIRAEVAHLCQEEKLGRFSDRLNASAATFEQAVRELKESGEFQRAKEKFEWSMSDARAALP